MNKSIHSGFENLTPNPSLLIFRPKKRTSSTRFSDHLYGIIAAVIKGLERLFSQNKKLFLLYGTLFYHKVLQKELAEKNLPHGARILHIGCGALPYTAYYLARRGYSIDAVDYDHNAVTRAQRLIHSLGLGSQIRVFKQNGTHTSSKSYDAIWISLHVADKNKVLINTVKQARSGTWIIYREPRPWLSLIYKNVKPSPTLDANRLSSVNHRLGKKSVSLQIPERIPSYAKND